MRNRIVVALGALLAASSPLFAGSAGEIGDLVFEDTNANGIQDPGEPTMAGITVELFDSGGGLVDTTTTDATGFYSFGIFTLDTFTVVVTPPTGASFSPADQGGDDTKDSDVDAAGRVDVFYDRQTFIDSIDAGYFFGGSLGDLVWDDVDGDGLRDGGEAGIADVLVRLLDGFDVELATTTTTADGSYLFEDLMPGDYRIRIDLPDGFIGPTISDVGGDDTIDSDIDGSLTTGFYTLGSAEDIVSADAGLIRDPDAPTIPEPASLTLLAASSLAMLRRRRR